MIDSEDTTFTLVADYLDELLEPPEAERAAAAIARNPSLVVRVTRMRGVVYRAPSASLAVPAFAPPRRRGALLRLAAAFAAGVLLTLLAYGTPDDPPEITSTEPNDVVVTPETNDSDDGGRVLVLNRRLR